MPNVLMLGTGEYTTGYTSEGASTSDKSTGVVALVMLDLKRRGKVGRLGMCGTDGRKLPKIREHMQAQLGDVYAGCDPSCIETWPKDGVVDREAYKQAVQSFGDGDVAIIFTPDDTHAPIAKACLERGIHVLITKPPVKTLAEHAELAACAASAGRLAAVEVHKRFDPIYTDARDRIASLGPFSFFSSYMSQPKVQLQTFRSWAGRSSDISYYLNSHHVDYLEWCLRGQARPEVVTAFGSYGVANERLGVTTEDTATLAVTWRNRERSGASGAPGSDVAEPPSKKAKAGAPGGAPARYTGSRGHATFTASWVAPRADVHSQQRFFYMGQAGELNVDQAHRGYSMATDENGYSSVNPLFWKPARSALTNEFAGQRCYGYLSFEAFVDAAAACNAGGEPKDFDGVLPTLAATVGATAILEAGRRSLDAGGRPFELLYADEASSTPCGIRAVQH